jgi:hypothetical protein
MLQEMKLTLSSHLLQVVASSALSPLASQLGAIYVGTTKLTVQRTHCEIGSGAEAPMIGAGADASISVYHRHQAQSSPTYTRDSKRQKSQIARIIIQQFDDGRRKKACHTSYCHIL